MLRTTEAGPVGHRPRVNARSRADLRARHHLGDGERMAGEPEDRALGDLSKDGPVEKGAAARRARERPEVLTDLRQGGVQARLRVSKESRSVRWRRYDDVFEHRLIGCRQIHRPGGSGGDGQHGDKAENQRRAGPPAQGIAEETHPDPDEPLTTLGGLFLEFRHFYKFVLLILALTKAHRITVRARPLWSAYSAGITRSLAARGRRYPRLLRGLQCPQCGAGRRHGRYS